MNDYTFGNKILELRTKLSLSQTELAEKVGVTNKAVSKWETGKSKPTTNVIRKLAALFNVDVEEMLCMRGEQRKMEISKIVITGGPSAGKTTAMSWVQNAFTQMGYTVLFVPETATELITGGVAPWTCGTNAEYQKCQMKLQHSQFLLGALTAHRYSPLQENTYPFLLLLALPDKDRKAHSFFCK